LAEIGRNERSVLVQLWDGRNDEARYLHQKGVGVKRKAPNRRGRGHNTTAGKVKKTKVRKTNTPPFSFIKNYGEEHYRPTRRGGQFAEGKNCLKLSVRIDGRANENRPENEGVGGKEIKHVQTVRSQSLFGSGAGSKGKNSAPEKLKRSTALRGGGANRTLQS